jgi:thiol-disulfide isomerase/thioredoxin
VLRALSSRALSNKAGPDQAGPGQAGPGQAASPETGPPENGPGRTGLVRVGPLRARRRTVVAAAVVLAAVLAVVVATWPDGGNGGVTTVDGNASAVLYPAGHRASAPAFTGTTLTGSRMSFSSYRGQVVVVNFWGSWCVPCREEAPILAAVAARYRSAGVSFLGVDVRDTTASARAFASRFHVTYPSVSDPGSVITQDFSAQVPIAGTPTTLVIDRTGHIAGAIFGTTTYSALTAILAKVR